MKVEGAEASLRWGTGRARGWHGVGTVVTTLTLHFLAGTLQLSMRFAIADFQYRIPQEQPRTEGQKGEAYKLRPFSYCHGYSHCSCPSCCIFWPDCILGKLFLLLNTLYIQPTAQLVRGWFASYIFPSQLCKIIGTAPPASFFLVSPYVEYKDKP